MSFRLSKDFRNNVSEDNVVYWTKSWKLLYSKCEAIYFLFLHTAVTIFIYTKVLLSLQ